MLFYGGEQLSETYDTMKDATVDDTLEKVLKKLKAHFKPAASKTTNICRFRTIRQLEGEKFDEFTARLRSAAKPCGFTAEADELINQILEKCSSEEVKRLGMSETTLTLDKLIVIGRTSEAVETQLKEWKRSTTTTTATVNMLDDKTSEHNKLDNRNKNAGDKLDKCFRCGKPYPHPVDQPCKATNAQCMKCKLKVHYARCCSTSPNNHRQPSTSTSSTNIPANTI